MADNSLRTPGTGETIRTVEIGGAKYGVAIPADGAAGTLATVSATYGLGVDVHHRWARIQSSPTSGGGTAYTAGDSFGGEIEIAGAVRAAGAWSMLRGLVVTNKLDATTPPFRVFFADRPFGGAQTDNSPFDPADADLLFLTGMVSTVLGTWQVFVDNSVMILPADPTGPTPAVPLRANSGTSAYAYVVVDDAVTVANGDIGFTFLIEQH